MPWQKNFDEDSVLDQAMELFWQRGYRAVTMSELVDVLGVNRASLYATYGGKEALFLRALRRYDRVWREEWLHELAAAHGPLGSIRRAFDEITEVRGKRRHFGCLLVNATIELPSDCPTTALVKEAFEATERFFEGQIREAKRSGELASDVDPASLAPALMALLLGIRVLARARKSTSSLKRIRAQLDTLLPV